MNTSEFEIDTVTVEENHTIDESIAIVGDNLDNDGVPIMSTETTINSQESLSTSDAVITEEQGLPESEPVSPKTEGKFNHEYLHT